MYNNLRATDNRNFVNRNQTNLEVNALQQEDSRFKMSIFFLRILNLILKTQDRDGKTYYKTHESFRFELEDLLVSIKIEAG
jgi:hypothetical protein